MLADRDPAAPERAVLPNGRADAGEAPELDALLEVLVDVAARTGARTVLEGVETVADLALARDLGVSLAQGFLFRDRFVQVGPQACG